MLAFLSRPARLLRRAAFFGLAYLAVLVVASLAEAAGPRAGGSEEGLYEAGEPAGVVLGVPAGGADDRDDPAALPPALAPAVAIPVAAARILPTRADAPRAPLRAMPAARGPPHRA